MKKLGLALVLLFLMVKPAIAATMDALPVYCDSTKIVFEQLKGRKFRPVLMGNVEKLYTIIMVNDQKDMAITFTLNHEGKNMTCIFVGADKNTEFLEFQKFI